jgi:hypothetical protein
MIANIVLISAALSNGHDTESGEKSKSPHQSNPFLEDAIVKRCSSQPHHRQVLTAQVQRVEAFEKLFSQKEATETYSTKKDDIVFF